MFKAVLFDVDGTLYDQDRLRLIMAAKIIFTSAASPFKAQKNIRIIKSYRAAQEILRKKKQHFDDLYDEQIRLTCELSRSDFNTVKNIVHKWFETIPLNVITSCKRSYLESTFEWLSKNNIKTGLFSDYFCNEKAVALNIDKYVSVSVSSMDRNIGVFKPDPKGFLVAAEKLGFKPEDILFVGDRVEVDVVGANNAGMRAALLGKLSVGDNYNYEIKSLNEVIYLIEKD